MQQNINLLSALPTPKVTVFPTTLLFKILGAWLLMLVLIYVINLGITKSKESDLRGLEQNKQGILNQIDTITKVINNIKETKTVVAITAPIVPLAQTLGFSRYLEDFAKFVPDGMWLEIITLTEPEDSIKLQGTALSAALLPTFLNSLNQSKSLNDKQFATLQLQKTESTNMMQFILNTIADMAPANAPTGGKNESIANKI